MEENKQKQIIQKKNPVLKKLKLRENEEDIRALPERDYRQLQYRVMCDQWCFLNAMQKDLNLLTLVVIEIAKKSGVDIDQILKNLVK